MRFTILAAAVALPLLCATPVRADALPPLPWTSRSVPDDSYGENTWARIQQETLDRIDRERETHEKIKREMDESERRRNKSAAEQESIKRSKEAYEEGTRNNRELLNQLQRWDMEDQLSRQQGQIDELRSRLGLH